MNLLSREAFVYLDGQIIPESEAKISVFDLIVLRGYGVFDFLRTYRKQPFRLWDHLKRFEASAKALDLRLPLSLKEIAEIIEKLLKKVSYPEANIKIFLTGGQSPDQYLPADQPTFFAFVYPIESFSDQLCSERVSLVSRVYERPYPACKSTHYLTSIAMIQQAQKQGADDVLFLSHKRQVLETGRANFFGVKGKTIITSEEGILPGITRQVILEILEDKSIPIEVRSIAFDEVQSLEGAFITLTTKGVVPVARIDQINFSFHPLIDTLIKEFSYYTQNFSNSRLAIYK